MKEITIKNACIRLWCNKRNWALPICVSSEKKLISIQVFCFVIEYDWISEKDVFID